jgi:hypothetical protein
MYSIHKKSKTNKNTNKTEDYKLKKGVICRLASDGGALVTMCGREPNKLVEIIKGFFFQHPMLTICELRIHQ